MSEILILKNGSEYPLIVNGFVANDDAIRLGFITENTLEEIIEEFSDPVNTSELTVKNEESQTIAYAKDFVVLDSVVSMDTHYPISDEEYGKAVTLTLKKQPIDARVGALEDTVDTLALEILGE